jgi:hypothetical protein
LDHSDDAIAVQPFPFASADDPNDAESDGEPVMLLSDSDEGVTGRMAYRADRYARQDMEQFCHRFRFFAERLLEEPGARVAAV